MPAQQAPNVVSDVLDRMDCHARLTSFAIPGAAAGDCCR